MKLKKGDVAPDFTTKDMNGKTLSLSGLRKKSPVVLVFLRGFR